MQNVDAYELTVASSIAAKIIGQPRLLDEVRNRFRLLHSSKRTEKAMGYFESWSACCTGSGLRLMDACRLRIQDIDFERKQIIIRKGKGNKDRCVLLAWLLFAIPVL